MSACDGHGTPVACPENRVARGTRREFRGAYLITLTPHTQNTNERLIYHPDHGRQPLNSGPKTPNPTNTLTNDFATGGGVGGADSAATAVTITAKAAHK